MVILPENRSKGDDLTFLTFVNHKRAYFVHKNHHFCLKSETMR